MSIPKEFLTPSNDFQSKKSQELKETIRKNLGNYKDFLLVPLNKPTQEYSNPPTEQIQGGIVIKALNKEEAERTASHYFLNLNCAVLELP